MATDTQVLQVTKPVARIAPIEAPVPVRGHFRDALRLQQSLTAPFERKALAWLAARMPAWVSSDHLTVLGFAAMFLAGASYAMARFNKAGLLLATVCLALNWFGDSLDGTVARLRNRQRPRYGFYVDHVVDMFGGFFLMGGLSLSGYVDWRIGLGMYVAFLMLSVETYLATYSLGKFQLSCAKMGPTEIRILLALGNITLWISPGVRFGDTPYRLFDACGVVATAGMLAIVLVQTVKHTVQLYREESLR